MEEEAFGWKKHYVYVTNSENFPSHTMQHHVIPWKSGCLFTIYVCCVNILVCFQYNGLQTCKFLRYIYLIWFSCYKSKGMLILVQENQHYKNFKSPNQTLLCRDNMSFVPCLLYSVTKKFMINFFLAKSFHFSIILTMYTKVT